MFFGFAFEVCFWMFLMKTQNQTGQTMHYSWQEKRCKSSNGVLKPELILRFSFKNIQNNFKRKAKNILKRLKNERKTKSTADN